MPTLPCWANHMLNAAAVAHLIKPGREGKWAIGTHPNSKMALVGFSMGSLKTLLAGARL